MDSNSIIFAFLIYQGILTLGLIAYVVYLGAAFASYRNAVSKAFNELLLQDEELARRINQMAGAFALMDAFFPATSRQPTKAPSTGKKAPTLFNFGKNNNTNNSHLSVVDNSEKKDKSPSDEKGKEDLE